MEIRGKPVPAGTLGHIGNFGEPLGLEYAGDGADADTGLADDHNASLPGDRLDVLAEVNTPLG